MYWVGSSPGWAQQRDLHCILHSAGDLLMSICTRTHTEQKREREKKFCLCMNGIPRQGRIMPMLCIKINLKVA